MKKTSILFVCMGNICRSPTAEYVFRAMIEERGLTDRFELASAGTAAWRSGHGADPRSVEAGRERGYDLRPHRARGVLDSDFEHFDHLFAMDAQNLEWLMTRSPSEHRAKISLFLDHAPGAPTREAPDPYYGVAGFERVLDLIEAASQGYLESWEKG
ncbi:MAG: low molecular weight phosphotyrosine protein phosphatase [Planctomycetes bacterium]|nr:low molecular weight phosphotyrosine protein phosphatase [Planctomycetota bacterium]